MTATIICPYCNKNMELRKLGLNQNKTYFYECVACLARSPLAWNEIMANSMARMRNGKTACIDKKGQAVDGGV